MRNRLKGREPVPESFSFVLMFCGCCGAFFFPRVHACNRNYYRHLLTYTSVCNRTEKYLALNITISVWIELSVKGFRNSGRSFPTPTGLSYGPWGMHIQREHERYKIIFFSEQSNERHTLRWDGQRRCPAVAQRSYHTGKHLSHLVAIY